MTDAVVEREIEWTTGWTLWAYSILLYFGFTHSGFVDWIGTKGLAAVVLFFTVYAAVLYCILGAAVKRADPFDLISG